MARKFADGHLGTKLIGDAKFIAALTPGTAVQFSLSGKLGGTINGLPVSGQGHLEYTFNHGASMWELETTGLASGPQLPAGNLVYLPQGASGSAAVATTGVVSSAAPWTTAKDRHHFKLKGRVASVTVGIVDDVIPCDTAAALTTIVGVDDCISAEQAADLAGSCAGAGVTAACMEECMASLSLVPIC